MLLGGVLCFVLLVGLAVLNDLHQKHARQQIEKVLEETISQPNVADETFGKQRAHANVRQEQQRRRQQQKRRTKVLGHNRTADDMNVLLFYADDWTMQVMGKLNKYVQTPNIDALADDGILFTNNCVTTSMCWISRGTMLTGTYASRHRFLEPSYQTLFHTHPWHETVFPLLKSNGYYTGLVGKWHAPQPFDKMEQAFDYRRFYYGNHWEHHDGKLIHVTDLNLLHAKDFLKTRPLDRPFALKVAFFASKYSSVGRRRYLLWCLLESCFSLFMRVCLLYQTAAHAWDGHYPNFEPKNETKAKYYNDRDIPTPKTATESHWQRMPFFFKDFNEGRNRWRQRFEPDYYQDNIKDLYRMATEVDTAVGKVIEELKTQGVYNKTLIMFTTDNGNMHGEHGLAEKWYPYEESIRVPLVIRDPRMPQEFRGTYNDDWTLSVDLAPTMLGAANIPQSDFMQGRDMSQLYLYNKVDGPPNWRQDWFYEYNRGDQETAAGHEGKFWIDASFALITKEWKYIYWPQHQYEQIFHRPSDPYEENDLLNGTKVQPTDEVYSKLKARYTFLKAWVQSGKPV